MSLAWTNYLNGIIAIEFLTGLELATDLYLHFLAIIGSAIRKFVYIEECEDFDL